VLCHSYTPALPPSQSLFSPKDTLLFTHGAGGTLEAPAVVHFCTGFSSITKRRILAFQGSSNLKARVKGFEACWEYATQVMEGTVVFAGRSMGARAAVLASTQLSSAEDGARLILVSYPLQGPKEVRDQILLDLPPSSKVLFILGGRDAMCPLPLLEGVRAKMQARTQIVVVRGADHGMNVRPAAGTRIFGERAGRVAARWVDGRDLEEVDGVEEEGTVYIGDEEE
jgi:predicted alpha/beta-hydrolase family hydrolase